MLLLMTKNQQLFFLIVCITTSTIGAHSELLYHQCDKNLTQNDILHGNTGNLLINMAAQSALRRFAISSSSDGGYDVVYGVARCNEDMSNEACSACITRVEHDILSTCPGSGSVHSWREKCYLHYDVTNFIGKWDWTYASLWRLTSIAEDLKAFEQGAAEVMGEVMAEAVGVWELTLKFKSGESSPKGYCDSNVTIYGMAQCTQDLCALECNLCLESLLEAMSKYCEGSVGCRIFGSECVLRYEIYKFLWVENSYSVEVLPPAPSVGADY